MNYCNATNVHKIVLAFLCICFAYNVWANTVDRQLLIAAMQGNLSSVKKIIDNNEKLVDARDSRNQTPLMRAAWKGHIQIVEFLLSKKAQINTTDNKGYTALMRAAWRGHLDIVKLLIKNGADVNIRNEEEFTALMLAAWSGYSDIVKELLAANADVDVQDRAPHAGYTAIMRAAAHGYKDIVQQLLAKGASIDKQNSDGSTALSLAKKGGHIEIAKLLQAVEAQ